MQSAIPSAPDASDLEERAVQYLLAENALSEEDLIEATKLAEAANRSRLLTLNQMGVLTDTRLASAYAQITQLPIAEIIDAPDQSDTPILNPAFMRETRSLILEPEGPLYLVDPLDQRAIEGAEFALGFAPRQEIIPAGDWLRHFQYLFQAEADLSETGSETSELERGLADQDRDAPIVRQVAAWLSDAADMGASDIHFDARRNALEVHYRLDGVLKPVSKQSRALAPSVIARIKVLSGLDLGERNRSQDGRATIVVRGRKLDVRVSIIPTIDGESAVIRLLDRPDGLLSLQGLGFSDEIAANLKSITQQKYGLFIVSGPTGSGKTTTLYACLEQLKGRGLKILSVEDPVEYHFDHVNQVQISDKAGRSFAGALKSFLRHDPDVILVGEIRDPETAQVAVQAALSGHLVLATIHAIDTTRVRTRLVDMGVESFRLDACLTGSLAQRLVRQLCTYCRNSSPLSPDEVEVFKRHGAEPPNRVYTATACEKCNHEGYQGRLVIAHLARRDEPSTNTNQLAYSALELVAGGETSLAEISGLIVP